MWIGGVIFQYCGSQRIASLCEFIFILGDLWANDIFKVIRRRNEFRNKQD